MRTTRAVYGFNKVKFSLSGIGEIEFAQWKNTFDYRIPFTQDLMDFYKDYIKKGDLVIDIGANTGDTTVPLALSAGKEGMAIAFDPNPLVFSILLENAKLNTDKSRIIPVCAAIAEEDGEFYYNSSEATFSNGGISKTKNSRHGKYVLDNKIKGVKLTKYLSENHSDFIDKLSFIKIDAEGYDKDIIKAMLDLIEKCKPHIITECFKYLKRSDRYELFDLLSARGYKLFFLKGFYIKPVPGKQIEREDMIKNKTFDIFATSVK